MPKILDWPPVWLLLSMFVAWGLARYLPSLTIDFVGQREIGFGLMGLGLLIMTLAAMEMLRAHTTLVPRRDPDALVTTGLYRISRNPIYLADWIVLFGWIVYLGVPLAFPLLWVFPKVIEKRFIAGEEARIRDHFGEKFDDWAKKTRRWI